MMSVYFIRAASGPVKIGWAKNVTARLRKLQWGHYEELNVIRIVDGDFLVEMLLHTHFREQHIRGEWFRYTPAMLTIDPSGLQSPVAIGPAAVAPMDATVPARALEAAVERAGSRYQLAKAIGVTTQAIYAWGPVAPMGRALAIERATGVSRHDLCPEMYPREKKAS